MSESETYIIDQTYASLLPDARGRGMSDRELSLILSRAISQCPILERGDKSWLNNPNIRTALFLNAYIFGESERIYGGLLSLTHPIRVAHRAFNFENKPDYTTHDIQSAFLALNHDAIEDAHKYRSSVVDQNACKAVMLCWVGSDDAHKEMERDLWSLTNSPHLNGHDSRLQQSLRITGDATEETNYTPRAMVVRYVDKLDTLEGDLVFVSASLQLSASQVEHFYRLGKRSNCLVVMMSGPISDKEKILFESRVLDVRDVMTQRDVGESLPPRPLDVHVIAVAQPPSP